MILFILYAVIFAQAQEVAIKQKDGITQFWYNSSNTHVATFISPYNKILPGTDYSVWSNERAIGPMTVYVCVTDTYWGNNCDYWGTVDWNTGNEKWGYKPETAQNRKDKNGKSHLDRMTINKHTDQYFTKEFRLTIENPSPGDSGTYVLGLWWGKGYYGFRKPFQLKDMFNNPEWTVPQSTANSNPLKPHMQTLGDMVAIADPTFEDTMAAETGFSDVNLWLEWMRYNAGKHNKTNCYVCGGAKPHLGTVPLNVLPEHETCVLSLFTNTITKAPKPAEGITIYPGNYACYGKYYGAGKPLGNFTEGYCESYSEVSADLAQNQVQSLGDVYWICGGMKIRIRMTGQWTGECAMAKAIMPLHILSENPEPEASDVPKPNRRRRSAPAGSFDPHVYIDAIGVPRVVPDEFKERDHVATGFESLIPIITVNKNIDWINYIYYNQQRFVNYTRDALQGLAEQLEAALHMTLQNRMVLDMLLAEKGSVCKMIPETSTCCTYIPDNTGPNGKVTLAIQKLEDLSKELKQNSGLTNSWDQYFTWIKGGWQALLTQIGIAILVMLAIICCVLPCIRKCVKKAVDQTTPPRS